MDKQSQNAQAQRPLRIGVLVDGFDQPRWALSVLQDIRLSPVADLVVTIRNAAPLASLPYRQRLASKWRSLLYGWYVAWDDAKYGALDDPLVICDAKRLLGTVPVIDCVPRMTVHTDRFEDDDIRRIRDFDLDVILRFGFRLLRGAILDSARYGVWSYHHGDNRRYRGGPPGFWEVAEGNSVTGCILQVITEELDAGQVLCRSYDRTDPLSLRKSRQQCYGTGQQFVLRKIEDVYQRGRAGLSTHTNLTPAWAPYGYRLYVTPTNREMLGFVATLLRRRVAAKTASLFQPKRWVMAYHFARPPTAAPRGALESPRSKVFHRFKPILPPPGQLWADPFPIKVDGRFYVFFENWPVHGGKGRIEVMEWLEDDHWGSPVVALERPYHLSYPYLFEWEGQHYMIPESVANFRVELYRTDSFPVGWELDRVLLDDIAAVDPTIVYLNGRCWMFVTMVNPGGSPSTELHIFHAANPLGPWLPHALNPVKSDIRSARPAGRPFTVDGAIYRPAQDCSERYGGAIVLNRIDLLSDTEYREVVIDRIDPGWAPGLVGIHTINSHSELTVVDALAQGSRFEKWARKRVKHRP